MAQEAKIFKYQTPEFQGVQKSMILCNSDLMKVMVQVVKDGGENNLHSHTGDDSCVRSVVPMRAASCVVALCLVGGALGALPQ